MAAGMLFLYAPILIRIIMSNASATARLLSLALLFLSVAPFASLYALLFSADFHGAFFVTTTSFGGTATRTATTTTAAADPKGMATLSNVLQSPNATIEELWEVLLFEAGFQSIGSSTLYISSNTLPHHWAIVIPWGISLLLGIVVPAFLTVMSFANGARFRQERRADDLLRRERKSKRREGILKAIKKIRKTLAVDDFDLKNVDDDGIPRLSKMPPPRCGNNNNNNELGGEKSGASTAASGSCAICLTPYAVGDNLAWSSNPSCSHVFHEDCILAWLLRERHDEQRCPCCRQGFLEAS